MLRETRISLRTRATRRAGALPPTVSAITTSESRAFPEMRTSRPPSVAGPPAAAANVSRRSGSWTTPTTGFPSATSASETQKNGSPFA